MRRSVTRSSYGASSLAPPVPLALRARVRRSLRMTFGVARGHTALARLPGARASLGAHVALLVLGLDGTALLRNFAHLLWIHAHVGHLLTAQEHRACRARALLRGWAERKKRDRRITRMDGDTGRWSDAPTWRQEREARAPVRAHQDEPEAKGPQRRHCQPHRGRDDEPDTDCEGRDEREEERDR